MNVFNRRQIKYSFATWKEHTKCWNRARKVLVTYVKEKVHYKIRQAFNKWNSYRLYEDLMMRL